MVQRGIEDAEFDLVFSVNDREVLVTIESTRGLLTAATVTARIAEQIHHVIRHGDRAWKATAEALIKIAEVRSTMTKDDETRAWLAAFEHEHELFACAIDPKDAEQRILDGEKGPHE